MLKHDLSFRWNQDKDGEPSIGVLFRLDSVFRSFLDEVELHAVGEPKLRQSIKTHIWGSAYLECLANYLIKGLLRDSFNLSVPAVPGNSALLAEMLSDTLERQSLGQKLDALGRMRGKPPDFDTNRQQILKLIEKRNFLVHYKASPTELRFAEVGFAGKTVEEVLRNHGHTAKHLTELNERLPNPPWIEELLQQDLQQLIEEFKRLGDWLKRHFDLAPQDAQL